MTRLTAVQIGSGWFPEVAGGLNRYYFDLLRALPAAGVDCRGLVVGSPAVDAESAGRVHAYARPDAPLPQRWRSGRRAAAAAWRDIPADRPAVHVAHFALYAYPMAAPPKGRPTVVHFHGPWAAESAREGANGLTRRLKVFVERSVYRRADRFIVLSNAFKTVLCDGYRIDPARVSVIPGGVDVARFTPAYETPRALARERLGWPTDRPIVLSVRRLVSRMGLENLIDSMAEVRRRVPDALCLIAGRGRLHAALQSRIAAAGLTDHVRLLGFVPDADLPWVYRAADVSILPSASLEGFGLSAVESLAAGTPVLVANVGGLPEVVARVGVELIVHDTMPAAWAATLKAALSNPAWLPTASACRAEAAAHFDWPLVARQVAAIYQTAAGSAGQEV